MQHLQEQQQKNKQALDGHNLNDHDLNSTQSSDKNSTKVTHQPSLSPGNADKADGEASSFHSAATSSNIQSQAMGLINQMGMGQLLSTLTGGAMGLADSGGDNQGGAVPSDAISQTDVNEILSQIDMGKMISTVFDGAAGSQSNDPQTMEAMISKVAKDIPGISEAESSDMQAAVSLVMQQKGIEPLLSAAVGAVQKATVTSDDHKESTQYEVFQKNYAALCNTMTDVDDLLKYFVVEKIINEDELEEITCLTVKSDKVRKLLIHIVGPLKAGHETGFYAMLRIMKSYGHIATQTLSDSITKELQAQADAEHQHTARKQQEDKKEELEFNFRSPHAPPLPQNLIERQQLLSHMVDALTRDEAGDNVDVNLLVTGMGGYGKSTLTKALCHHSSIKKCFPGGFLWIHVGPMPKVRPIAMLLSIYNDLTGRKWNPIASNVQVQLTEEEIMATLPKALQSICNNKKLLVIVDDVWETKDLHAYIKTFSCCKIVVTTRRNDLTNTFSCGSEVSIEGMTTFEAIELLAIKEFHVLKPSTNDKLHTLAINLHCWPLLLNLVRNQFQAHCKKMSSVSPDKIIEKVTQKLYDYGLTAFDPKEEKSNKELAAIASIKASLDFLKPKDLNRLIRLVTSFTFATIFPRSLLYNLWEISLENVDSCCDELWSMGLLSYTELPYATNKDDTVAVEVHSVIVQYVFDNELGRAFNNLDEFFHAMMFDLSTLYKYMFDLPKSKDSYIETLSNVGFMDSIITPMQIKAVPMLVHVLTDLLFKDLQNDLPFPIIRKVTYIQIREQQKEVISLLDKGKVEEALALIDEESLVYMQHLKQLLTECDGIPIEIKQKIFHLLPMYKMALKLNFKMRVQSLDWLNSENRTDEQNYNISRNANDKVNELLMPAFQEIQDLYQIMFSQMPGLMTDTNSIPLFMDTLSKVLSSDHTASVSELLQEFVTTFSKEQNVCLTQ